MFLQIHTLTSYHAGLLNRDEAGLAKRLPFGNAIRLRVSSQCLKRHWRKRLQETLPLPSGWRTRHFFGRVILPRLRESGIEEATARALTTQMVKSLLTVGKGKVKTDSESDKEGVPEMRQSVLFGQPEADYLLRLAVDCARESADPVAAIKARIEGQKGNFKAMLKAAGYGDLYAGLEGALFGRFVTSNILSRVDACVHVAHALTVHGAQTEVDYFTVVDDLGEAEETGAAHADDMELGAGLFYGYVVVDVPLLLSNLSGCEPTAWRDQPADDARAVVGGLVEGIATVTPGAKLGSTAPYSRAELVLLEAGEAQPRTLANAYLAALAMRGDVMQQAVDNLGSHLQSLDAMYGNAEKRFAASTKNTSALGEVPVAPLSQTIERALDAVFGAA